MCASPISASDVPADPINRLWRASRVDGAAEQTQLVADVQRPDDLLEAAIVAAVARHLGARALLSMGKLEAAQAEASETLSAWDNVAAVIAAVDPQMTVRAHAFHARLASRHLDAYRDFARRQLLDLARTARLKSEIIPAEIAATLGDARFAAEALDRISKTWRADLAARLPGLRAVEMTAAGRYAAAGDEVRAQELHARAATISGVIERLSGGCAGKLAEPAWIRKGCCASLSPLRACRLHSTNTIRRGSRHECAGRRERQLRLHHRRRGIGRLRAGASPQRGRRCLCSVVGGGRAGPLVGFPHPDAGGAHLSAERHDL